MTSPAAAPHILTFAQTPANGGVERAMLRLVRGWLARGRRVTLVLGREGNAADAAIPPGCETIVLGDASYRALLGGVPGAVERTRPDVIFCPGNHYTSMAAWLRLRLGRRCPPIVAKISNALERQDMSAALAQGYRWWLRLHPRFLDAMVAMTPAMRAEAVRAIGIDPARVAVIPNPPTERTEGGAPIAIPEGPFVLGIGRLVPQKRWDRLIEALPHLRDRAIPLLLLGEGPERARLERLVAKLGLDARVHMPGHAADPLPIIARATVVALTSDFEGVPAVLREAASVGTPVVATDSSVAVREIVDRPEQGDVVGIGDTRALTQALDRWTAPAARRPAPRRDDGDPVGAYLALFDSVARGR